METLPCSTSFNLQFLRLCCTLKKVICLSFTFTLTRKFTHTPTKWYIFGFKIQDSRHKHLRPSKTFVKDALLIKYAGTFKNIYVDLNQSLDAERVVVGLEGGAAISWLDELYTVAQDGGQSLVDQLPVLAPNNQQVPESEWLLKTHSRILLIRNLNFLRLLMSVGKLIGRSWFTKTAENYNSMLLSEHLLIKRKKIKQIIYFFPAQNLQFS